MALRAAPGPRRTRRGLARPRRLDRYDAGGIDLPGAVAGAVAADELVIHGWDLARATGQEYTPDPAALQASYAFLCAAADDPSRGGGIFGPVVPVPEDAPLLDRAVALSGRDPHWAPPRQP
ncbi:TIGR03086 family metal-binding protein [Streptomyces sp. YKOK-I1]